MHLMLSGEGPTDLGGCMTSVGDCDGNTFRAGPMAMLVDQGLEKVFDYSLLQTTPSQVRYSSKQSLVNKLETIKSKHRSVGLPGKNRGQETGFFYKNALAFGVLAMELENQTQDPVIAVLFRDSDGTNRHPGQWREKWQSMVNGFARAGFERGVPMLPKPTSEAWLLCAAQNPPYQHCSRFENLAGNTESPNHPKKKLSAALGGEKTSSELCEWLDSASVDIDQLTEMESFNAFYQRLISVATSLIGKA